ncbi:MAG TPA: peptidase, partial [Streptomyces sp.]|nr:peptidase [Streptomyces sp.]
GDAPDIAPQTQRTRPVDGAKTATSKSPAPRTAKSAPRTAEAASPTSVPGARESYTVARGDSLSGIASTERVKGGWERLYAANRTVVGSDPDLIIPGQRLTLDVTGAPQRQAT